MNRHAYRMFNTENALGLYLQNTENVVFPANGVEPVDFLGSLERVDRCSTTTLY
jgi:hypothetical protein